MQQPNDPHDQPMNAFQAALAIVNVCLGISNGEKRNHQLAQVGSGTLLLAFCILGAVLYGGMRLFVYLVERQVAP
ncbi:MAG TPA: hypothetical protein VLI06_04535 [Solimonas sp.]|nr:hypothetical protein [Solimonas sp.]